MTAGLSSLTIYLTHMTRRLCSPIVVNLLLAVALLLVLLILGQFHPLRRVVIVFFLPAMYVMETPLLRTLILGVPGHCIFFGMVIAYLWAGIALLRAGIRRVKDWGSRGHIRQ